MDKTDPGRRLALAQATGLAAGAFFGPLASVAALGTLAPALAGCASGPPAVRSATLGFKPVPPSTADRVVVPEGYTATTLAPWGEAVGIAGAMPAWKPDASNTAAEQALQMGQHHDGMHYFALDGSRRGLMVTNHEYTDDGLLHVGGMTGWTAEKVSKAQASHGISVIEIEFAGGGRNATGWRMVRPSRYARRITATTPFALGGPAAGHPLMKTAADPDGRVVLGTFADCAAAMTPWGTYLAGEENFKDYFATADQPTAHEKRWSLKKTAWYRWDAFDERFDAVRHPNEPNRFGWIVEVDPMDPQSRPVKRTALGRASHEGAWVAVTQDGRAVVYSGEDAAFEYIYKFVSRDRIKPAAGGLSAAQANAELLDHGTLYVARFDADGSGRWLPLVHGEGPLSTAAGFADLGEIVVKARQASDALQATKMDRPEWLAIDHASRWVYASLTNNDRRGKPDMPGPDAANPRADNRMGQIIRWRDVGDFDAPRFEWSHLLLAGDPASARDVWRGNIQGDPFACPDTLAFDSRGVLWIGCDIGSSSLQKAEMAPFGNNQLLACNPATGEVRRFLTGPVGCELTAATWTPDGRTLFVNIQHPGESPGDRSDPAQPRRYSNWPDFNAEGRPRSAMLAIRRDDGGVIGA